MKHIATHFYPSENAKDRSSVKRIYCECDTECPLLAQGKCVHVGMYSSCLYGKTTAEQGPTRRAAKYRDFRQAATNESNSLPKVSSYDKDAGMAYIGEYVYLPYTFIDIGFVGNNRLPMLAHVGIFNQGSHFMMRSLFTPEMVVKILRFRPQALMGGEIVDYQRIHMPRFARDLKVADPELYAVAQAIYPDIDSIAERGTKRPLPINQLGNFSGRVIIDGNPAFWYGSSADMELPSIDGVSSVGTVKVRFTPTDDVTCVIVDDADHIKWQAIIDRKKN